MRCTIPQAENATHTAAAAAKIPPHIYDMYVYIRVTLVQYAVVPAFPYKTMCDMAVDTCTLGMCVIPVPERKKRTDRVPTDGDFN